MPRFGLYTRKSHDDRKITEKSIGEQVAACRSVAEALNLDVVLDWEESRTAMIPNNRPLWKELIAAVYAGRIDAILCWHVNRLVRNMQEGGELVQLFVDGKIKEIRTPYSCYRTGDNILPLVLEAASAAQQSIDNKHVVERSSEGKFQNGGWNCLAPQGYRNFRDPSNAKKGVVGRDPERFDLIRKAWDLMLTEGQTVKAVVDTLNETWGYRTRQTMNRMSAPLSLTGMYQVFQNPFYAGFVHRSGRLVKGVHEAMVTPAEFEAVQRYLRRKTHGRRRSHLHAFTGLMRCAYCGQQVTAERKRLRNGTVWETYRCSDSFRRCTQRGISLAKVETTVAGAIDRISLDPELAQAGLAEILRSLKEDEQKVTDLVRSQESARAAQQDRLIKLADMWMAGLITDRGRYKELEKRELAAINDATMGIENSRREIAHMRENAERAYRYAAFCKERFLVATDAKKREVATALGNGFRFHGIEKRIEIDIDPLLLEFCRFAEQEITPLEPVKSGSSTEKSAAFGDALLSGRREKKLLEPVRDGNPPDPATELPPSLLEALKGPLFPDLGFGRLEGAA